MPKNNITQIGLFGFGSVGKGLYDAIEGSPALPYAIKQICIKHKDKPRAAPAKLFTHLPDDILSDPAISIIVEATDDTEAAYRVVRRALLDGKAVITASKKMLAQHLPELLSIQKEKGSTLLYESAACAAIPIIRNLEVYYGHDVLRSAKAIVNGSTNYILTQIQEHKVGFETALRHAQEQGFAESNPELDIQGHDARNKWAFLCLHAFGTFDDAIANKPFLGIENVTLEDVIWAETQGMRIKLVAQAQRLSNGTIASIVMPQLVSENDSLAFVKNEYNGVEIETSTGEKQFFLGRGAGGEATASAILGDLSAIGKGYQYKYDKLGSAHEATWTDDYYIKAYISCKDPNPDLPFDDFDAIETLSLSPTYRFKGTIHVHKLTGKDWWKKEGVSLILDARPIIEAKEWHSGSHNQEPHKAPQHDYEEACLR